MNPKISSALERAQKTLETYYQVQVGINANEFCSLEHSVATLGTVLCNNAPSADLEISLLLDRDYFSASLSPLTTHQYSILFEETSHFFYLGVNHLRGRQVSKLELETQSEIDRLICSLSLDPELSLSVGSELRSLLLYNSYQDHVREKARVLAVSFLDKLSNTNPHKWRAKDFEKLSQFFNADLAQKFHMARYY